MKEIIKTICEYYKLKWYLDDSLFILNWKNEKLWEFSDFFYFLDLNKNNFLEKSEDYYKDIIIDLWKKEITENKLEDLKQFDKNLNLIILLKLEKKEDYENLKKQIYKAEENPYYSNKFVIVYIEKQLEGLDILKEITPDNLSKSFDILVKNRNDNEHIKQFTKEDLIFDLITSLHFITFKFKINEWNESLNIYKEAFSKLTDNNIYNSNSNIYNKLEEKNEYNEYILNNVILKNNDIWDNLSDFENEIIKLSKEIFLDNENYNIEDTFDKFTINLQNNEQL